MHHKIIYLFVFLLFILPLFVFSLGRNLQEREGLTTREENEKKDESQESENNTNLNLNSNLYDNYNHYNQSSIPTIFYGKNESKVILDAKTKTLYLIDISGNTTTYNSNLTDLPDSNNDDLTKISFYSENGSVAKINAVNNVNVFIKITDKNGDIQIYKSDYTTTINTPYTIDKDTTYVMFYGKNESKVILDAKTKTLYLIDILGNTTTYNSNLTDLTDNNNDDLTRLSFYSKNGSIAKIHSLNNVFIKITDKNGDIQIYYLDYTPKLYPDYTIDPPYTIDTDIYNDITDECIHSMSITKDFNNDNSDLYILKSKIVPPLSPAKKYTPLSKNYTSETKHDAPIIKYQNGSNEQSQMDNLFQSQTQMDNLFQSQSQSQTQSQMDNLFQSQSQTQTQTQSQFDNLFQTQPQYKPHLTSYATSQIAGTYFNKFKNANSINSEFIPIPVLNSFHSFGK